MFIIAKRALIFTGRAENGLLLTVEVARRPDPQFVPEWVRASNTFIVAEKGGHVLEVPNASSVPPSGWEEEEWSPYGDLPQTSKDFVAAAELEAQSIREGFQHDSNALVAQAHQLGVSSSDLDFAPGNLVLGVAAKGVEGRQAAADHLFCVTTDRFWKLLNPDVEAFMAKLDYIWRWTYRKFQINSEMPETLKRALRARVLKLRAADAERAEQSPGDRQPTRIEANATNLFQSARARDAEESSGVASSNGALAESETHGGEPATEEADAFVKAFEQIAAKSEAALAAFERKLRAPKMRVLYQDVEHSIWSAWQIRPDDVTVRHINHALHSLARKSEGGVEIDPLSCEAYGVDHAKLTTLMRASLAHVGDLSAGPKVPRIPSTDVALPLQSDQSQGSDEPAKVEATPVGKRGRKRIFTQEQLNEARQMKSARKSNNEIAKILYATNTSTPGQRRSVSTTLRHHFGAKK